MARRRDQAGGPATATGSDAYARPAGVHGRPVRRVARIGLLSLIFGSVAVVLAATVGRTVLRTSLPQLDGTRTVPTLHARVDVERDALGVVTLTGRQRDDLAYATGLVHAQDRFFQMDLLRRVASGELAALIGPAALDVDRRNRAHRFRARAHAAVATLAPAERHLLERYVAGVNDGLAALSTRPFEYWVLGERPAPWTIDDSALVVYAMYFDLQYDELRRTLARATLRDRVPPDLLAFLLPLSSHWDAPLDGGAMPQPSPPIPATVPDWLGAPASRELALDWSTMSGGASSMIGSSSWAVDGAHAVHGGAIIANDMHLGLALPNIWYRISLVYPDANGRSRRVTGVSLPGAPIVVAGSNGHVAWGFTNSYGNFLDLIELQTDARDPLQYRVPGGGWERASVHRERIDVRGGESIELEVADTRWGPMLRAGKHVYAVRWSAHDARAVNVNLLHMEEADSLATALAVGQRSGIPTQNLLVADARGGIGWTLAGPLPRRPDATPASAALPDMPVPADDYRGWNGYLTPREYPIRIDPPAGRLWSANNRQLPGAEQAKIGDAGADIGARATQIRDDLLARDRSTERDMLAIQTDDRARWIDTWRRIALDALNDAALAGHPARAQFKRLVAAWNGRADADEAGYELVRAFYGTLYDAWFGRLDEALADVRPGLSYRLASSRTLAVMETLARHRAWTPPGFPNWNAFIVDRIDQTIAALTHDGTSLDSARWGTRNRAAIMHPFARMIPASVPVLDTLLAAPHDPLPGDVNMPRVQGPSFGASERMIVSPGREEDGIFHMPGGQSGNPASPYFLAGHDAWVRGDATPFLPGPPQHRLALVP